MFRVWSRILREADHLVVRTRLRRGYIQNVALNTGPLERRQQTRILFRLVFGSINVHSKRCWKYDSCGWTDFCVRVEICKYTLSKSDYNRLNSTFNVLHSGTKCQHRFVGPMFSGFVKEIFICGNLEGKILWVKFSHIVCTEEIHSKRYWEYQITVLRKVYLNLITRS